MENQNGIERSEAMQSLLDLQGDEAPDTTTQPEIQSFEPEPFTEELEPENIPGPVCWVCDGKGFIEKQAGQFMRKCEACDGTGLIINEDEVKTNDSISGNESVNKSVGSTDTRQPKRTRKSTKKKTARKRSS